MGTLDNLKSWWRWGYWLDTPQGICLLLSIPICWIAALVSLFWPVETPPLLLSAGPLAFIFTPLLAFVCFVRFGQLESKQFSSSWLATIVVLFVAGMPFYIPYLRSTGMWGAN